MLVFSTHLPTTSHSNSEKPGSHDQPSIYLIVQLKSKYIAVSELWPHTPGETVLEYSAYV